MSDRVIGLLVTGDDVMEFWTPVAPVLNHIDGLDRTWHFTLWNDPPVLDAVIASARAAGGGLQRIIGAGDDESYETLHDAGVGLWERGSRTE